MSTYSKMVVDDYQIVQNDYEIAPNNFQIGVEEFLVSCKAGKEPINRCILHQIEESQDQQTNTPGPTCQHIRTNMPTHQHQHANTQGPATIMRKEDQIIK